MEDLKKNVYKSVDDVLTEGQFRKVDRTYDRSRG